MRLQGLCDFIVFLFIADHYGVRIEFDSLLYQKLRAVVGCQQLHFEKVAMLPYDVKSLPSYRTRRSQYGYMPFFHNLKTYISGRIYGFALVP